MARKMHPGAERADEKMTKYSFLTNLDPRGKTAQQVVNLAQRLRDVYGEVMIPMEVLNRDAETPTATPIAVEAMPMLANEGFLPILGSADDERDVEQALGGDVVRKVVDEQDVQEAVDGGAVGMVSYGGIIEEVMMPALEARGGMRLVIPCVSTGNEFSMENRIKKRGAGVRHRKFLPKALQRFKIFPLTPDHVFQPGSADSDQEWNDELRRVITTQSTDGNLNSSGLVTGFDTPEKACPALRAKYVGKMPFDVAIGAKLDSPEQAFAWLEAVCSEMPESPLLAILAKVQTSLKGVVRLRYLGRPPRHIVDALGDPMRRRRPPSRTAASRLLRNPRVQRGADQLS